MPIAKKITPASTAKRLLPPNAKSRRRSCLSRPLFLSSLPPPPPLPPLPPLPILYGSTGWVCAEKRVLMKRGNYCGDSKFGFREVCNGKAMARQKVVWFMAVMQCVLQCMLQYVVKCYIKYIMCNMHQTRLLLKWLATTLCAKLVSYTWDVVYIKCETHYM